ncbi:MAG: adenine deaminase [Cellulosilyticaceae bacterium]
MEKKQLKRLIDIAAGRIPADTVIKNCKVIDVYNGGIIEGDVALCEDLIAGVGQYTGPHEIDAEGKYLAPGLIDSHIHIESSYVSPEELGRLVVPHGTTTIMADPHEIANVCGERGIGYMLEAAKHTALDIKFMLPSCVPATPFEHSGAVIDAKQMIKLFGQEGIWGLGEFMDFPGVVNGEEAVLDKLAVAKSGHKVIDGHSPGLEGNALNAYAAASIRTDHECATVADLEARIARGMYVLLRQGSACHDLRNLLKGVTATNSRRCVLCCDDCQPKTILSQGHINHHLRICVEEGIDPITAIQMGSLNSAECFGLADRGAVAPGLRADLMLVEDLVTFNVEKVWIGGQLVAQDGRYLPQYEVHPIEATKGSFHVKEFSLEKLRLPLRANEAHVITILPGSVVTRKEVETVSRDSAGNFIYNPEQDIAKVAVIERHQNTGNVAVALLKNYGIKAGAVALSIAHDSHNIITVGTNDEDMAFAVEALIKQEGGIVLARDEQVVEAMPMPIAGLMSDQSGQWVDEKLTRIHELAHDVLGISSEVEPVMTLCFMSLPVIPEVKLTDLGLFDVTQFQFISVDA